MTLPTPQEFVADADNLMRVIRDVVAANPDHPRLGKRLAEAAEYRDRLAARATQHDAATTQDERINQRMHMETIVGRLDDLCRQVVMSSVNPTGEPGRHMSGDAADKEVARRLKELRP